MSAPRSEQAARWLAKHGGTMVAAGLAFGVTRQAVWLAWRRLFGDRQPPSVDARADAMKRVAELAGEGRTLDHIASEVPMSRAAIEVATRRRGIKIISQYAAVRARVATAIAAVKAGASRVDAAIDNDVSQGALGRALRRERVVGKRVYKRDGQIKRALERVLKGASVTEACRLERCSSAGVYKARQRRRNRVP